MFTIIKLLGSSFSTIKVQNHLQSFRKISESSLHVKKARVKSFQSCCARENIGIEKQATLWCNNHLIWKITKFWITLCCVRKRQQKREFSLEITFHIYRKQHITKKEVANDREQNKAKTSLKWDEEIANHLEWLRSKKEVFFIFPRLRKKLAQWILIKEAN